MTPVSYHTFYDDAQEITLSLGNYYRSSESKKNLHHCYEFTIIGQFSGYSEMGFSSVYHTRTFVAYYDKNILRKYNNNDTTNSVFDCSIKGNDGDTFQVCYNSLTSQFHLITKEKHCQHNIPMDDPVTWFIYLDHSVFGKEDKIRLNLGKRKFMHQMPSGFLPWSSQSQKTCKKSFQYCVGFTFVCLFLINK